MQSIPEAVAGNFGKGVRSDCQISLRLTGSGGIRIVQNSKVQSMYGRSNEELIRKILGFYEITHAQINMNDSGALPFVIAARLEAVIKMLQKTTKVFLPEAKTDYIITPKDRRRISRLYIPGNTPALMINAGIHHPDGIILDLEDAVAPEKKNEARYLVRNALLSVNFYEAEKMVRINQVPSGLDDLEWIVPYGVNLILVPKCEDTSQIIEVDRRITEINKSHNSNHSVWLMPIVESALGIVKAYELASASSRVVAMAIGLEDYTADLGVTRTAEATESFYARSVLVNACKAAGIQAIDSVFSDVSDIEGLATAVRRSKGLGFDGMGCIHPRQIMVIHQNFAPETGELKRAVRIVKAYEEAKKQGLGVVALGTKMIDAPVVKRAEKLVALAVDMGLISEDWREKDEI